MFELKQSQSGTSAERSPRQRQAGSALLVVLLFVLLGGTLVAGIVAVSTVWQRAANATAWRNRARYSTEGALEFAHALLEAGFYKRTNGATGNVEQFREFLEDSSTGMGLADGQTIDLVAQLPALEPKVESLLVTRVDRSAGLGTDLFVQAEVWDGDERFRLNREITIGGKIFGGMNFVMLTNDANCILCHAEFDSTDRYGNTDSYDPVIVGILESLKTRLNNGASIAGDLVIKGSFTDRNGTPLSSPTYEMIHGVERDAEGKVQVDDFGQTTAKTLDPGNDFFLNTDPSQDPVEVPESFPPPFPDETANGRVDDSEYRKVADAASGKLTGGVLYEVPRDTSFSGSSLPNVGTASTLDGEASGNLILVGTEANPIEIDGKIAVDGDLVIQGWVKGQGSIWVRGNAYIAGDLKYLDGKDSQGERTYGVADDSTTNLLGITTGGNILAGNYLFGRGASPYDSDARIQGDAEAGSNDANLSFTEMEMAIFNRREFAKTQQLLPDSNGDKVANPNYDPNYIPRYYSQNDSSDVHIFMGGSDVTYDSASNTWEGSNFSESYWDAEKGEWGGKEHPSERESLLRIPREELPENSAIQTASPTNRWLSEDNLWSFWETYEKGKGNTEAMTIEAALYTNNMMFAMASKRGLYEGKLEINGALVSRDMGILSTGGLKVNYDARVGDLIQIKQWDVAHVSSSVAWPDAISGAYAKDPLGAWKAGKLGARRQATEQTTP